MNITQQLAKHLRDVHFGGNWTTVNLRDQLKDVSWERASIRIDDFNSIATLVYHSTYYVRVLLGVLQNGELNAKDEYSFQLPPINSEEEWRALQNHAWAAVEEAARLIEQLPDEQLYQSFTDEKYGNWFRNINGIIEHLHYHLGQVVLLKKLLAKKDTNV